MYVQLKNKVNTSIIYKYDIPYFPQLVGWFHSGGTLQSVSEDFCSSH